MLTKALVVSTLALIVALLPRDAEANRGGGIMDLLLPHLQDSPLRL